MKLKKIVNVVFAILMIMCVFPVIAYSEMPVWDDSIYNVDPATVITYPVEGGYLYFGQYMETDREYTPDSIHLIGADPEIKEALIPATVNGLAVTSIFSGAFDHCTELIRIYLPETLVSVQGAFRNCRNLQEICVSEDNPVYFSSEGALFERTWIGDVMRQYPASNPASSFTVPEGTRILVANCFSNSEHLQRIYLPDSLTWIEPTAFSECKKLTEICYAGTESQWLEIAPSGQWNYTIHYDWRDIVMEKIVDEMQALPFFAEFVAMYESSNLVQMVMILSASGVVVWLLSIPLLRFRKHARQGYDLYQSQFRQKTEMMNERKSWVYYSKPVYLKRKETQFKYSIYAIPSEDHVLVVIDGLDTFFDIESIHERVFPTKLPPNVKLITSSANMNITQRFLGRDNRSLEVNRFSATESHLLLDKILLSRKRRISNPKQKECIDNALKTGVTPLQSRLLSILCAQWHSVESDVELSTTSEGLVLMYIDNLSSKYGHNRELVLYTLSLIAVSPYGITEEMSFSTDGQYLLIWRNLSIYIIHTDTGKIALKMDLSSRPALYAGFSDDNQLTLILCNKESYCFTVDKNDGTFYSQQVLPESLISEEKRAFYFGPYVTSLHSDEDDRLLICLDCWDNSTHPSAWMNDRRIYQEKDHAIMYQSGNFYLDGKKDAAFSHPYCDFSKCLQLEQQQDVSYLFGYLREKNDLQSELYRINDQTYILVSRRMNSIVVFDLAEMSISATYKVSGNILGSRLLDTMQIEIIRDKYPETIMITLNFMDV